jgi:hypothetical protein
MLHKALSFAIHISFSLQTSRGIQAALRLIRISVISLLKAIHFCDPETSLHECGALGEQSTQGLSLRLFICLFIVYLTTLFQFLRQYSVDVGGKPAASAQFVLNPDSSARAI